MEQPTSPEPFLMPGPQFEQNQNSSWFNRHSQKLVLGAIIILLALGAFSFYKSYQSRQTLLKTALQEATSSTPNLSTPTITPTVETSPAPAPEPPKPKIIEKNPMEIFGSPQQKSSVSPSSIPQIRTENGKFIAQAAQGNGATHLARYALKEYLKDKDLKNELSAEQKIFIEDYLQKHAAYPPVLQPGDELSFSETLIKEAIARAQTLSPAQIQNLSHYVPLVPSI